MIKATLSLFIFFCFNYSYSQDFYLDNQWESLGPNNTPGKFKKMSSLGVGPTDFIKSTPLKEGLLLTGSIPGGLFYSTDKGETWLNSGSDNWDYSTCSYADFFPEDANIWFGASCFEDDKSGPSTLNNKGGIYRTTDQGGSWKKIGTTQNTHLSKWDRIFSFKFNPQSPSKMYILSSNGLITTSNCLADNVKWEKESQIKGLMYDMVFIGNKGFISNKSDDKWHIYQLKNNNYSIIQKFETINEGLSHVTLQPFGNQLLLLLDYTNGADKLVLYNIETDELTELSRSQRVVFGHGFTFGVNPHNKNEIYVGGGTRLRRWNFETKKFEGLGSNYHVDVEYVSFDPFDENIIYMSNHGGVAISYDKGKNWEFKNNGLSIAMVLGIDVSETDPNEIVIGTYHDGSIVYADWDSTGIYSWRNINGGDALIPIIDPKDKNIIYTSNQYRGGGLYVSKDKGKTNINLHSYNRLATAGWEMATVLHPIQNKTLFFNFKKPNGNIDIVRTNDAFQKNSAEKISDFKSTHQLDSYKVFRLFNSKFHPNILLAYVLHFDKNEAGKSVTRHRLFRTLNNLDSAKNVITSWHEIELPRSFWLGDVEIDRKNFNKMYISYSSKKRTNPEFPNQKGLIYYCKYRNKNYQIKRNNDISLNISSETGGGYNLIYYSPSKNKRFIFMATRDGVFLGTKSNLKGKGEWQKIGYGLPHCKLSGIHFSEKDMLLTVGLNGRGVWRISLKDDSIE